MNEMNKNSNCCKSEEKHIKGIVCDVKNCEYHDCETHCTAKQILVGPSSAANSGETACTTFKPRCD